MMTRPKFFLIVTVCNSLNFVAKPKLCTAGPPVASNDTYVCHRPLRHDSSRHMHHRRVNKYVIKAATVFNFSVVQKKVCKSYSNSTSNIT